MTDLTIGDIVPGERIGSFYLGMPRPELIRLIPAGSPVERRGSCEMITAAPLRFWIDDRTDTVTQVLADRGFKGRLLGVVSVEDSLNEVRERIEREEEDWDSDTLIFPSHPGVCFDLGKEAWGKSSAEWGSCPVDYFAVFVPDPPSSS